MLIYAKYVDTMLDEEMKKTTSYNMLNFRSVQHDERNPSLVEFFLEFNRRKNWVVVALDDEPRFRVSLSHVGNHDEIVVQFDTVCGIDCFCVAVIYVREFLHRKFRVCCRPGDKVLFCRIGEDAVYFCDYLAVLQQFLFV